MDHTPRPLSARQLECLKGVAEHLDSQQIAYRFGISPHTVDGHIAAAIKALGARSRRDAVKIASQRYGQSFTGQFPPVDPDAPFPTPQPQPSVVAEVGASRFDTMPTAHEGSDDDRIVLRPWRTIASIVGLAAGFAIVLLALDPLLQSAMRLAAAIQSQRSPTQ